MGLVFSYVMPPFYGCHFLDLKRGQSTSGVILIDNEIKSL